MSTVPPTFGNTPLWCQIAVEKITRTICYTIWPAPFFETVLNFDTHRSLQMTSVCAHAGAA